MSEEHMLTTVDNPFNPHTQYDEWFAFDTAHGYNSMQFLARIVRTSDALSDADQSLAIEQGIDEIVKENVLGIYRKVSKDGMPVLVHGLIEDEEENPNCVICHTHLGLASHETDAHDRAAALMDLER